MITRHNIHVLRVAGHTHPELAELTSVPQRSVERILTEPPPQSLDDAAERQRRRLGRTSLVQPIRPLIEELLQDHPTLKTQELLRLAKEHGFTGQKTQLYALVAELRPRPAPTPLVRFEGLPGEFSQHDFGQVNITFGNGTRKKMQFFASRLKYSRYVRVTIVPDQTTETLVRGLVEHLHDFGGAPLVTIFDQPRTLVLKWSKTRTVEKWNPLFQQVLTELGIGADVCWPYRPQEKGSVENLVGWVKGSFFKPRTFWDEADLLEQLEAWHREVNHSRPCRATGIIPAVRLAEEQTRLRPLRVTPPAFELRMPVQVAPTGYVTLQGCRYSMPPETLGLAGTLYLGKEHVRIRVADHEAKHPRLRDSGAASTLPLHRAAMVKAVRGKQGKLTLKREQLRQLGPDVEAFLTELRHRRPDAWPGEVEALHALQAQHGDQALVGAVRAAQASGVVGSEYVAHHLGGVVAMGGEA